MLWQTYETGAATLPSRMIRTQLDSVTWCPIILPPYRSLGRGRKSQIYTRCDRPTLRSLGPVCSVAFLVELSLPSLKRPPLRPQRGMTTVNSWSLIGAVPCQMKIPTLKEWDPAPSREICTTVRPRAIPGYSAIFCRRTRL